MVMQRVSHVPGLAIPVLYLDESDGCGSTIPVPLTAMTEYLIANSAMSRTWMIQRARAVGLLFDYIRQLRGELLEAARTTGQCPYRILLSRFMNNLVRGTCTPGLEGILDKSGLYWQASSPTKTTNLVRGLWDFVGWLKDIKGDDQEGLRAIEDGLMPDTGRATLELLYAARYRRAISFLAHLEANVNMRVSPARQVVGRISSQSALSSTARFPRQHLGQFIRDCFVVRRTTGDDVSHEDATAKLATMICAFGGLRRSELLHLWTNDVQWVDGKPVVFLHHPVSSVMRLDSGPSMTRSEILRHRFGMTPRNRAAGKLHAGWKGIKLNRDNWAPVYWLPVPGIEEALSDALKEYIHFIRPRLMRERRAQGGNDHPFLLVSAGYGNQVDDLSSRGSPYTSAAYRNAWRRAVRKLSLACSDEGIRVSKRDGLTVHGLRHLYGATLREMGVSAEVIQECMHHVSRFSQEIYTQPTPEVVNGLLRSAAAGAPQATLPGEASPVTRSVAQALAEVRRRAREQFW